MIQKVDVRTVNIEIDDKLSDYVTKKIGTLDRYVSRHDRESLRVEVVLKEQTIKAKKVCSCEVIFHLPHDKLVTKESTINIYAAIDIVEAKLKNQLKKHKELHGNPRLHRRLVARLRSTKHDH
jgi:ribosomal subunit interface protein